MAWTDKMVEDLKVMWTQGLTTGEIGKRLGVSKNSIVGKVHRLQLDARPSPIKKKEDPAALVQQEILVKSEEKVEEKVEEKAIKKVASPKAKKTSSAKKEFIENVSRSEPKQTRIYGRPVKLTDLDNHTCRWPVGDPKDDGFRFCGKKVRVGSTYCEEHSAIAYVKPTKK